MRFTQEVKDKWIAALRSGEYRQGKEELRRTQNHRTGNTAYCCLGVLADVCNMWDEISGNEELKRKDFMKAEIEYLLLSEDQQAILTKMNDGGRPFSLIANYIEQGIPAEPENSCIDIPGESE